MAKDKEPGLANELETAITETGERMLPYFRYSHLPQALGEASRPFADLAVYIVRQRAPSAERTAGLRKLLEAKDCIVRATLDEQAPK